MLNLLRRILWALWSKALLESICGLLHNVGDYQLLCTSDVKVTEVQRLSSCTSQLQTDLDPYCDMFLSYDLQDTVPTFLPTHE